jgi:hypothetical protein
MNDFFRFDGERVGATPENLKFITNFSTNFDLPLPALSVSFNNFPSFRFLFFSASQKYRFHKIKQ